MKRFLSRAGLLVCCVMLGGCGLPRGAGVESEVLAAAYDPSIEADFVVETVTRDSLARFAAWPATGVASMPWINRQEQPANRIIAPGDKVAVTVWNTEENSLLTTPGQRFISLDAITVSPGGSIFLPYVEDVRVAGMSPEHAREVLQEKFIEIIPSAQVQLELNEGRQNTVSLVGGVETPGAYPLPDQNYSLLALLAEAGGVTAALNNPQIRLIRNGAIYGVSVERLLSEPALDTTLQGGDKVFVEADERFFLSLGAAGREAVFPFPNDQMTALEAMSIMGGVSDARADPQGILVMREYPAAAVRQDGSGPGKTRMVFAIDLTSADGLFSAGRFQINSGDLVYATESPFTAAQTIFGLVDGGFAVVNQALRY